MSLLQIGPTIFGETEGIIDYLRSHRLLSQTKICSRQDAQIFTSRLLVDTTLLAYRCAVTMTERKRCDISDGICWYCSTCKTTKSIRESSFFEKSRLPLKKWMLVMYWWARQYPVSDCKDEAEIAEHTAIDMYQWLHEVCSTRLLQDPHIVLGGSGVIVEIASHYSDTSLRYFFGIIPVCGKFAAVSCYFHLCSITVEGPPHMKCGCLGWWILLNSQLWGTWR